MNTIALRQSSLREHFRHLIPAIIPYDDIEQKHMNDTCRWVESGAPLLRVQNLNNHLVWDFVMFDER